MKRDVVFRLLLAVGMCVLSFEVYSGLTSLTEVVEAAPGKITQGALQIVGKDGQSSGQCPLKHTAVKTEISGQLARTTVTQEFQNPFNDKIEAVYVFPLPVSAAVDDMTMIVAERTVKGRIKRREEARAIYEAARDAGQVAGLLDQERPNIFTQSVANITPGAAVKVTISYVETLKYEDGAYEFVFPMVVGPRYIPQPSALNAAPDTSQVPHSVPDASRITPPVTPEGARAGHDISIEVKLDAGVAIDSIAAKTHAVEEQRLNAHAAVVRLKDQKTIPNKDFVLRFDVAGKKIADAVMTHRSQSGGFFTLMLQPPERVTVADVSPKEIVFVLDTSGSMEGFPIEKAKEAMRLAIDGMNPQDTFNLITFAGDTHVLFPQPVPATRENLKRAQAFLASRQGSGGTEMMKAIRTALAPSDSQEHVRIVCFMTDGYVGNDMEIVGEVQRHPNARVFAFGIGESVNRFLLDKMAEQGRGEVEYVSLQDDGSAAAKRFHERVRNPLLTDIRVEWGGLPVADIYPKRIPDLFSAKPLVLTGRYAQGARGVIRLIGRVGAQSFARDIPVELPESQPEHDVLATLWARTRIDDLMSQDYGGIQNGSPKDDVKEAITQLGLEYRLMTQFTSFVAVEEMTITEGGQPRRVDVPVELPEGVSYEGVFGDADKKLSVSQGVLNRAYSASVQPRKEVKAKAPSIGSGVGQGSGHGVLVAAAPLPPTPKPSPRPVGSHAADQVVVTESALSTEEQKQRQLLSKLHTSVAAIVARLKNKQTRAAPEESGFVSNGKAELQIWMTAKSDAAIEQLKKLGFEIVLNPQSSKLIIGRLPIENLEALAALDVVRYVSPMTELNRK